MQNFVNSDKYSCMFMLSTDSKFLCAYYKSLKFVDLSSGKTSKITTVTKTAYTTKTSNTALAVKPATNSVKTTAESFIYDSTQDTFVCASETFVSSPSFLDFSGKGSDA